VTAVIGPIDRRLRNNRLDKAGLGASRRAPCRLRCDRVEIT